MSNKKVSSRLKRALSIYENYEIFFVKYPPALKENILSVLESIERTYVCFQFFEYTPDYIKKMYQYTHEIQLTKRNVVFAILLNESNFNVELPEGRKLIFVDQPSDSEDVIFIEKQSNWEDIEIEVIKKIQLDTIWIGLLSKIGTDVDQFSKYMSKKQNFDVDSSEYLGQFLEKLDQLLQVNPKQQVKINELKMLMGKAKEETNITLDEKKQRIEQLIKQKFNSRMIIEDITDHSYLHLLNSRSYFHLIYVEDELKNRFNNFVAKTSKYYPHLQKVLNFDNFIALDQYVYSEFIFKCLKFTKEFINRTIQSQSYAEIIKKKHKSIIRVFRPSFDEYFLCICQILKQRAACLKEAVGSIIVKNKRIISTGYNGTAQGTINCYNGGCLICNNSEKINTEVLRCTCIHAEYNCILTAGITETPGTTLYSTKIPCLWCTKLIIQGKISKVIYAQSKYKELEYQNVELVKNTFHSAGVSLIEIDVENYN